MSAAAGSSGTGISLRAGLSFMTAFAAFGYHAWAYANGSGKKCRKSGKCGGGGKHGGWHHRKHHRHHHSAAADGGDSSEDEKIDSKSDPSIVTAIDVKSAQSVTKEAIKKDTESALAMMQAELKPLSDEFVAFVKAKWNFPQSALDRLSKVRESLVSPCRCADCH